MALAALCRCSARRCDFVRGQVVVKFAKRARAPQERSSARSARLISAGLDDSAASAGSRSQRSAGGVAYGGFVGSKHRAAVRYAEPNYIYRASATPNDPRFARVWGLNNTGSDRRHASTPTSTAPEGWDGLGLSCVPRDRRRQGRHRRHRHPAEPSGPDRQDRRLRRRQHFGTEPGRDHRRRRSRRSSTASATTTTVTARTWPARSPQAANNGAGVAGVAFNSPLTICKGLSCERLGDPGDDRQLHRLDQPAGREDDLDVARRPRGSGRCRPRSPTRPTTDRC